MEIVSLVGVGVWKFYMPILIIIGTIGNCLSVFVCLRMNKMKRSSSIYYLAALAITDEGNLLCPLLHVFSLFSGIYVYPGSVCQILAYLTTFWNMLSAWFVVAFTVERFVAVCYPLQLHTVCTVTRAKKIVVGLTALGSILCTPLFYILSPRCDIIQSRRRWLIGFSIFNSIVAAVVPFTSIAVLNILIIKALRRHAGIRESLTNNVNNLKNDISTEHKNSCSTIKHAKTTKMLLIVSSIFLCLNLPLEIDRLYHFIKAGKPTEAELLIQFICTLLFVTSFGINFFLYCASGQDFRQTALDMIFSCSRRVKSSKLSLFVKKKFFGNAPQSIANTGDCSTSQSVTIINLSTNSSSELQDLSND